MHATWPNAPAQPSPAQIETDKTAYTLFAMNGTGSMERNAHNIVFPVAVATLLMSTPPQATPRSNGTSYKWNDASPRGVMQRRRRGTILQNSPVPCTGVTPATLPPPPAALLPPPAALPPHAVLMPPPPPPAALPPSATLPSPAALPPPATLPSPAALPPPATLPLPAALPPPATLPSPAAPAALPNGINSVGEGGAAAADAPPCRRHRKRDLRELDVAAAKQAAVEQALAESKIHMVAVAKAGLPKRLAAFGERGHLVPRAAAPPHNNLWPNGTPCTDDIGPHLKVHLSKGLPARDALARCEAYDKTVINALPSAAAYGFAVSTDTTLTVARRAYDLGFEQGQSEATASSNEERASGLQRQHRQGGKLPRCFPPLHQLGLQAAIEGIKKRKGKFKLASWTLYKSFGRAATRINKSIRTQIQIMLKVLDPQRKNKSPPSGAQGLKNWAINLFIKSTPELAKLPELGGRLGRTQGLSLPSTTFRTLIECALPEVKVSRPPSLISFPSLLLSLSLPSSPPLPSLSLAAALDASLNIAAALAAASAAALSAPFVRHFLHHPPPPSLLVSLLLPPLLLTNPER